MPDCSTRARHSARARRLLYVIRNEHIERIEVFALEGLDAARLAELGAETSEPGR